MAAHGLQRFQLGHGGDAPRRGDAQTGNGEQLPVQVHVGALQRAVTGDVGGDDRPHPRGGAAAAEVHARFGGDLLPAVDGHKAVLHVHAHGNFVAVFLRHFRRKRKVFDGHSAKDAAVDPQVQIAADALLVPDAAAHLDVQPALPGDGGDGVHVGGGVVLGAVQIDHMQEFCPGLHKGAGLRRRVGVVDGHPVIIALIQPHGLAAAQVDGRK